MSIYSWLTVALPLLLVSCVHPGAVGIGGRYLDAKLQLAKKQSGDIHQAIADLEYVVVRDPVYQDSLTLLGRAYYRNGRYRDAFQILRRALASNPKDEIAWISLGLTDLRLNRDAAGIQELKGGLTLLSRASKDGYKGIQFWDPEGAVRKGISRTAFSVAKGPEEKDRIIRHGEMLLSQVDDEEWYGKRKEMRDELTPKD